MLNLFYPQAVQHYLSGFKDAFATYNGAKPRAMYHDSYEYRSDWAPDFLAEFEKRWGKLEPHIDTRWHEHERAHRAEEERVERLEAAPAPLQEQITTLRNDHDKFLQAFIEAVTALVETKSSLPQYPVPPAQAPEDGIGLPGSMLDQRR